MGFGLSAALFAAITLEDGLVVQSNFHDYRVLRINEMPDIEVHIVPSQRKPDRHGRAGHAADRTGDRQRLVEAHGPARVHAAVLAFGGQGLRRCA